MNKVFRMIGLAFVSLFMLLSYVSGALLLLCGGTYYMARKENPEAVENFTDTASKQYRYQAVFDIYHF